MGFHGSLGPPRSASSSWLLAGPANLEPSMGAIILMCFAFDVPYGVYGSCLFSNFDECETNVHFIMWVRFTVKVLAVQLDIRNALNSFNCQLG